MSINQIKRKVVPILKRYGVKKAGIFGSYAVGKVTSKSDVDLLVQLKKGSSLLDLVGLEMEIEQKLGKKVDLVTYKSLHPLLKDKILREEKSIL